MQNIRIGKDIQVKWSVLTNGLNIAFDNRDLTLFVNTPLGIKQKMDFTYEGNVLYFVYKGIDQKCVGVHTLTLWENYGKEGQTVVDNDDFVNLVKTTSEER